MEWAGEREIRHAGGENGTDCFPRRPIFPHLVPFGAKICVPSYLLCRSGPEIFGFLPHLVPFVFFCLLAGRVPAAPNRIKDGGQDAKVPRDFYQTHERIFVLPLALASSECHQRSNATARYFDTLIPFHCRLFGSQAAPLTAIEASVSAWWDRLGAFRFRDVDQKTRNAGSCPSRIWPPSAMVVCRTKAWAATL